MASLDVGKENALLQHVQSCDLGKVKLEPPDYYEATHYTDMGFTDWETQFIDISSSSDGSGKSILGADVGEEVNSLSARVQTANTVDGLNDIMANGRSGLFHRSLSDSVGNIQRESRISQLSIISPVQLMPSPVNQQHSHGADELPADFLELIPFERDIRSPLFSVPSILLPNNGALNVPRVSRQFWKAGDYDSDNARERLLVGGMDHVRVHPKFLHSNATSHKWVLGAIAELLDNALDEGVNGATFVKVDMIRNPRDGTPMLLIEDDGGGMNPDCVRQCMSLGYSAKSKIANTIGQYGNGFKTSTMRLGADVIVFSLSPARDGCSATQSIGLLSYSFLIETCQEDIIVPMIDYEIQSFGLRKLIRSNMEDWNKNMETIKQWSPYSAEADLLNQFKGMKHQGTKVIVYNLWENDQGQLELDFDVDPYDMQVRGANRDERDIMMAARLPNSRHYLTYKHSLRNYASILYLRLPQGFKIFLRGKEVEHHNLVEDLMFTQELTYKPQVGPEHALKETSQMRAVVTIGFVKDAREHLDVQGFNVYHKNRLIKPFWRIWNSAASRGRGVIGVLEANFVEPAHDKQGFERTIVLARLEARLLEMQKTYWTKHCHRVGYVNTTTKKNGRHSFRDDRNTDSTVLSPAMPRSDAELPVSPSLSSFTMSLRSQSHEPLQGLPQSRQEPELQVPTSSLAFTRTLQPQTHVSHLEARREHGTQAPSISLAFSGSLQSQLRETVSSPLQVPSISMILTRPLQSQLLGASSCSMQIPSFPIGLAKSRQTSGASMVITKSPISQIQEDPFSASQVRSEAEVQMTRYPLNFTTPLQSPVSEVFHDAVHVRQEPDMLTSLILSGVTRSQQLLSKEASSGAPLSTADADAQCSIAATRLGHSRVCEAEPEVPPSPIPVIVPRGLRSQIQHVPARAFLTDAISLTVNTMEETAVASLANTLRQDSTAIPIPETRPAAVEETNASLSIPRTIAETSSLQQRMPVIKRKSLEDLGRMFAKQVVTAERIKNAVNPVGATDQNAKVLEVTSHEATATVTSEQNSEHSPVADVVSQEVSNTMIDNPNDYGVQTRSLQAEVEKSMRLQKHLRDLEEQLQVLERNMSNIVKERDGLKAQLEQQQKQVDVDNQDLQMKLQNALMQIRELELENNRLRSTYQ